MAEILPLLAGPAGPVARRQGRLVSRAAFLGHVRYVAERLPDVPYALNLCEDRYLFLVAFAAVLHRGGTNLLPAARVPGAVAEAGAQCTPHCLLLDRPDPALPHPQFVMPDLGAVDCAAGTVPAVAARHPAAVLFTSGSTGRPVPHLKSWGALVANSRALQARFHIPAGTEVVATVPAQHMYGLETSVLLPLLNGLVAHAGRPFFPEDVRRALAGAAAEPVLITAPVHLRACVGAGLSWPRPRFVLSATAPLSAELAQLAEAAFGAPVLEVFGSTETGSIASRRPADEEPWRLYEGMHLQRSGAGVEVAGGHLAAPVPLQDRLRLLDPQRFELLGRRQDLVEVAGKRACLADLTHKLLQIEGVQDGVFLCPEAAHGKVGRLLALVVAPGLDKAAILAALAASIDPAFMPRPLHLVDRLPRAATGKLPRAALTPLLERLGRGP